MEVELELAKIQNASDVCDLLNVAYRGKIGWTTENELVAGKRSDLQDVEVLINSDDSMLLVNYEKNSLRGCICLEHKGNAAYIGSFAVNPNLQNIGLGKAILKSAEFYAINELNSKEIIMVVLSNRVELIRFYERQGYKRTGVISQYPKNLNIGKPIVKNLTIEQLVKYV